MPQRPSKSRSTKLRRKRVAVFRASRDWSSDGADAPVLGDWAGPVQGGVSLLTHPARKAVVSRASARTRKVERAARRFIPLRSYHRRSGLGPAIRVKRIVHGELERQDCMIVRQAHLLEALSDSLEAGRFPAAVKVSGDVC